MREITFASQQPPSQVYESMAPQPIYPAQMLQPVIATPQADMLWVLMIPLVFLIAPLGAVALILYFVGRAVRASVTLQVVTAVIVLTLFVQYMLIPFLIDL
jgi:hypothetical protein